MTNVFKVRDESNRFLNAIKEYFEISEILDSTIVKCKICNDYLVVSGTMIPIRALILQHLIQHLRDPHIHAKVIGPTQCFTERLKNNELVSDEKEDEKLK
jgi:hypothetical protein